MTRVRTSVVVLAACGLAALLLPLAHPFAVRVLYNPTASAPLGWYVIVHAQSADVGDFVAVRLPEHMRVLAAQREYLPATVPLLKRVAAVHGQTVCRFDDRVLIDARAVARALRRDAMGRPLPVWSGCRRLGVDEFFLLSPARASFDSRYFGPVHRTDVIGRAIPVWIAR